MKKKPMSFSELEASYDLPHKTVDSFDPRDPKRPLAAQDRRRFYAKKLRELGMSDINIAGLISDLYWDCFDECSFKDAFTEIRNRHD